MLGWLKRRRIDAVVPAAPVPLERVPVAMCWKPDTRLPIPDWAATGEVHADDWDDARAHAFWSSAAAEWLDALAAALPEGYAQHGDGEFLVLSTWSAADVAPVLRMCGRALRAIRRNLGSLASTGGHGPWIVLLFADQDDYYDYLSHYHDDGGEHSMSSGVFLHDGYGHFASWYDDVEDLEPVIVHELTHAQLVHLPIPLWLNEGIAVNTEQTLVPRLADPRLQLLRPEEMRARHRAYWTADTIQDFWSGKVFQAAGDGVDLAYDLARRITALAARDENAFRAYVAAAHWRDGGLEAEHLLGHALSDLIGAVLGEGDWSPRLRAEAEATAA